MTASRWLFFFLTLFAGIALGALYGQIISPIEYVDTAPDSLRADFRADYTLMVAEVYAAEQNSANAARRLAMLGSTPPGQIASETLQFARENNFRAEDIQKLEALVRALPVGSVP